VANRVLISGSLAGHPVGYGGNTWAFLQYVLGFRRLGLTTSYVKGQNERITALEKNPALIRTNLASHRTAGAWES
jgi:hypothetical protein